MFRCTDLLYSGVTTEAKTLYADLRAGRIETARLELCLRHRDGHPFWMLARLASVRGSNDQPMYLIGQYEGLGASGQRSAERLAELTHMALHDPLTSLVNRALLSERFNQACSTEAEQGGVLAVLMIDLDKLEQINDHHRHHVGDQVLQATARELQNYVRSVDTVTRLGGNEFVVLAHLANEAEVEAVHNRIVKHLTTATADVGDGIGIGASVGLTITSDSSSHLSTLLTAADRTMYATKPRLE